MLRVHVFLMCHNEEALLPSTVAHYRDCFPGCSITIFDNMSTDESVKLAAARMCTVVPWDSPVPGQLDERTLTAIKNNKWKPFVQPGTWVVVCDMDEWLVVSRAQLEEEDALGTTILSTQGWQMVGERLRADLSDIELKEIQLGFQDSGYSKRVCFKWDAVDPGFCHGCHQSHPVGTVVFSQKPYVLKHMASLGGEYFAEKNARRYLRNKENRENRGCSNHYIPDRERVMAMHAEQLARATLVPLC